MCGAALGPERPSCGIHAAFLRSICGDRYSLSMTTTLDAFTASVRKDLRELAAELLDGLGPTVVQALTGVRDRSVPSRWARPDGPVPRKMAQQQLRLAFRVWLMVCESEGPQVAAAWMIGANPRLTEDTPVTAIRELRSADVVGAAQAFIDDAAVA